MDFLKKSICVRNVELNGTHNLKLHGDYRRNNMKKLVLSLFIVSGLYMATTAFAQEGTPIDYGTLRLQDDERAIMVFKTDEYGNEDSGNHLIEWQKKGPDRKSQVDAKIFSFYGDWKQSEMDYVYQTYPELVENENSR